VVIQSADGKVMQAIPPMPPAPMIDVTPRPERAAELEPPGR
jgi:hypothetical protein